MFLGQTEDTADSLVGFDVDVGVEFPDVLRDAVCQLVGVFGEDALHQRWVPAEPIEEDDGAVVQLVEVLDSQAFDRVSVDDFPVGGMKPLGVRPEHQPCVAHMECHGGRPLESHHRQKDTLDTEAVAIHSGHSTELRVGIAD